MEICMFYITFPSKAEARRITRHLVENRLAACANLFSMESMYWWEGKLNDDAEWVGIVKTTSARAEKLTEEVIRLHPYEVPCILRLSAAANPPFGQWLAAETAPR